MSEYSREDQYRRTRLVIAASLLAGDWASDEPCATAANAITAADALIAANEAAPVPNETNPSPNPDNT